MEPANQNLREVSPGSSYYPEMGERAPSCAIVEASLAHYGRHYYLKFLTSDRTRVMAAIKAAGVRFNGEETSTTTKGELKTWIRMTTGAYDKFRRLKKELCTSAILLD